MGKVEVQCLVQRERRRIIIQCQIGLSTPCGENVILQSRQYFLYVANANRFAGG